MLSIATPLDFNTELKNNTPLHNQTQQNQQQKQQHQQNQQKEQENFSVKTMTGSNGTSNNEGKMVTKLGRKGDPRMHRAVAARLANPELTLFDALRLGGFEYPTNDDASVMDSEKVTLGQRKNQLSRRVRLARKQQKSVDSKQQKQNTSTANRGNNGNTGTNQAAFKSESPKYDSKASVSKSSSSDDPRGNPGIDAVLRGTQLQSNSTSATESSITSTLSSEAQKQLETLLQSTRNVNVNSVSLAEQLNSESLGLLGTSGATKLGKRSMVAEMNMSDDESEQNERNMVGGVPSPHDEINTPMTATATATTMITNSEEPQKRARIAKFHPDYAPLFVPPSTSVRNSLTTLASQHQQHSFRQQPQQQQQQQQPQEQQRQQQNSQQQQLSSLPPQQQPQQQQQQHLGSSSFTAGGIGRASVGAAMSSFPMGAAAAAAAAAAATLGPFGGLSGAIPFGTSFFPQASLFPTPVAAGGPQARPSAVAVASLSATAHAVGLTLEQLAMSLASSPSNLAKVLAECCSTTSDSALAKKKQLALHLHQAESRALYSKCMLSAGIDSSHCQENSPMHLKFALDAWQMEGKRLHALMGQRPSRPLSPDTSDNNNESNGGTDDSSHRVSFEVHNSSKLSGSDQKVSCNSSVCSSDARKNHDHNAHGHHEESQQSQDINHSYSRDSCSDDGSQRQITALAKSCSHNNNSNALEGMDKGNARINVCSSEGRHIHRLEGRCGHKAIVHIPKDGSVHIDFVIGDKVECFHGIEPVGKNANTLWPSKFRCQELEGSCSNDCSILQKAGCDPKSKEPACRPVEPKIINLSEISLADPEWNVDLNGSIDGSVVGLFKLGERDDNSVTSI